MWLLVYGELYIIFGLRPVSRCYENFVFVVVMSVLITKRNGNISDCVKGDLVGYVDVTIRVIQRYE